MAKSKRKTGYKLKIEKRNAEEAKRKKQEAAAQRKLETDARKKSSDLRVKAVEAYFAGRAIREVARRVNATVSKLATGGDLKFSDKSK